MKIKKSLLESPQNSLRNQGINFFLVFFFLLNFFVLFSFISIFPIRTNAFIGTDENVNNKNINKNATEGENSNNFSKDATLVDCFQYYKFDSVEIRIEPDKYTYVPAETMQFKGSLENKNIYPLVDGQIFLKIYRRDPDKGNARNGEFEVAELTTSKKLNIDAGSKKEIEFSFPLPKNLADGEYITHLFFTVSGKYNVSGLPFHSSMPGSTAGFAIKDGLKETIFFDKDNAKVNGKMYEYRQIMDPEEKGDVVVSAFLKNPLQTPAKVEIEKEIFFWDSSSEENKIEEEKESFVLNPSENKEINYTIKNPNRSVYYVRFTAKSESGQSVIGIRPTIKGIFEPKINFFGLIPFPLNNSGKSVIFACFHNASEGWDNGKIVLSLKNDQGETVSERIYEGEIVSSMVAIAQEFISQKKYNKLTLVAETYDKENRLISSSSEVYDCNQFSPSICEKQASQIPGSFKSIPLPPKERNVISVGPIGISLWMKIFIVFLLASLCSLFIHFFIFRKNQPKNEPKQ